MNPQDLWQLHEESLTRNTLAQRASADRPRRVGNRQVEVIGNKAASI